MKVVVATSNKHKMLEFRQILEYHKLSDEFELVFPEKTIEVPETKYTYVGNAQLKVDMYVEEYGSKYPEAVFLGDDSGLSVDLLGGCPGVFSARYGGPGNDRVKNIHRLYEDLRMYPQRTSWRARMISCVVAKAGAEYFVGQAYMEGSIKHVHHIPEEGFGYDCVFVPDESGRGFAMSQVSSQEKCRFSHRAKAFTSALLQLRARL